MLWAIGDYIVRGVTESFLLLSVLF
jgi:hypothetical protein